MTHRLRLVCFVVVCCLTSAALALGQGQSAGFTGFGFSGGLAPGAYQSMGTVPALLGQTSAAASVQVSHASRGQDAGVYGFQYGSDGFYSSGSVFWAPEYLASNESESAYTFAADPYPQANAPQNGNQSQDGSQGMNGNQNPNQNQNQNRNQGKEGQKKEQQPPQQPQYLTYTVKKKSLEEQAKTGKAEPVDFKSSPSDARVTVDGYFLGHTPLTVKIPYGKHLVSITKWGYQGFEQEINVTSKKSVNVNATLGKDW